MKYIFLSAQKIFTLCSLLSGDRSHCGPCGLFLYATGSNNNLIFGADQYRFFIFLKWRLHKNCVQYFCWIHFVQNFGNARTKSNSRIRVPLASFAGYNAAHLFTNIFAQINECFLCNCESKNMFANKFCAQVEVVTPPVAYLFALCSK